MFKEGNLLEITMKKVILSAICILFISSGAYSAPPALKMLLSEAREGIRLMTKRNMGTLLKSTPGTDLIRKLKFA